MPHLQVIASSEDPVELWPLLLSKVSSDVTTEVSNSSRHTVPLETLSLK